MTDPIDPISEVSATPEAEVQADTLYQDLRVICIHRFAATPTRAARRCGSPALRGHAFCYYHHPTYRSAREQNARRLAREFAMHWPPRRDARETTSTPKSRLQ